MDRPAITGQFESPPQPLYVPPFVPVAVGLAVGIAAEHLLCLPLWACLTGFGLSGAALVLLSPRRHPGLALLPIVLAGASVGAALHHVHYRRVEENHIVLYSRPEGTLVRLRGTAVTSPAVTSSSPGAFARWLSRTKGSWFRLAAEQLEGPTGPLPVTGLVCVTLNEPIANVQPGERLELFGYMRRFYEPGNPGQFDWAAWLRRRRVLVQLSCGNSETIQHCAQQPRAWWQKLQTGLRRRAGQYLLDGFPPDQEQGGSLLQAMLLGQRSAVDRQIDEAFVRTGTVHVLSVSGFHVGVLALFAWWLGKAAGLRPRRAAALVLIFVLLYMIVAEPQPPILRAGILAVLACIAAAMRRPTSTANWIAAGAVLILTLRPTDLFDAGFQLSFASVLAVIYLSAPVRRWLFAAPDEWQHLIIASHEESLLVHVRRWTLTQLDWLIAVAVAAWLVGAPLVAYHFGRFSPLGWLNSMIVTPLAAVVMLIGFGKLLLAAVLPSTSQVTGPVLTMATKWLSACVSILSQLPLCQWYVKPPPLALLAGWYSLLGIWAAGVPRIWRRPIRLCAAALLTVSVCWLVSPKGDRETLRLHLLSVGHGNATLIQLPNGKNLLYDAGSLTPFNVAASVIAPAMQQIGIRQIDAAILSHPNIDHYCGLLDLADRVRIKRVLVSPHFERLSPARGPSRYLLEQLQTRGIPVAYVSGGDRLSGTDPVGVDVLWPPPPDAAYSLSANDSSVVLRLSYRGTRILLTGDIELLAQQLLLDSTDTQCDVLALPHHGSASMVTEDFLQASRAKCLLRSTNVRIDRNPNSVAALAPPGTQLYNTADHGCIRVAIGPDGFAVQPFRHRP